MFKSCGLLGKKKYKNLIIKDLNKIKINYGGNNIELQSKECLLSDNDENKENNEDNDNNNKINIAAENFPLVDDRPSNED